MFEGNRHVFLKVMDKLHLFSNVLFMSPHVFVPDFSCLLAKSGRGIRFISGKSRLVKKNYSSWPAIYMLI